MMIFRKKQLSFNDVQNTDIVLENAEILITQKCNFGCQHCLRGEPSNKTIKKEALDAFFNKIFYIGNLSIGGGEISLEPDLIRMITKSLKEGKILGVGRVNLTTNGTSVTDDFVDALRELVDYVKQGENDTTGFEPLLVGCSIDDFHLAEMQKRGITVDDIADNLAKIKKSIPEAYVDFRQECDVDIINTGRARELVGVRKVKPLLDMSVPVFVRPEKNRSYLGGVICMSVDGEIIPINIPFLDERTCSYGNIINEDFISILSKMRTKRVFHPTDLDKEYKKFIKQMSAPKRLWKKYDKEYGYKKNYIFTKSLEDAVESEK
ncbi:MAG: radical SAM protein [Clostridia bacterium]|nr:radical SAM protein [Clostridia bacterium]